ncbi:hypothetical protein Tco_1263853 [Tanacetum coccineum]
MKLKMVARHIEMAVKRQSTARGVEDLLRLQIGGLMVFGEKNYVLATRISLGRMKKALGDYLMASNIVLGFLKAQVRAAQ